MNNFVKMLVCMLMVFFVCGCDQIKTQNIVVTEMKTPDVKVVPNMNDTYLVKTDDGAIWIVSCDSIALKITAKSMMFGPMKGKNDGNQKIQE